MSDLKLLALLHRQAVTAQFVCTVSVCHRQTNSLLGSLDSDLALEAALFEDIPDWQAAGLTPSRSVTALTHGPCLQDTLYCTKSQGMPPAAVQPLCTWWYTGHFTVPPAEYAVCHAAAKLVQLISCNPVGKGLVYLAYVLRWWALCSIKASQVLAPSQMIIHPALPGYGHFESCASH